MDSLSGEPRKKDLEKALSHVPYGTEKLKEAYDQALTRIKDTRSGKGDLARTILEWLVYSQRPLLIQELIQILAVDPGDTSFDKDSCPPAEALDSLCAGLVMVDNSTHIVRVVHKTAQEYFECNNVFPDAHAELLELCVTYMAFDEIYDELNENRIVYEFPFFKYACNNWHIHARLAIQISEEVLVFFENPSLVSRYGLFSDCSSDCFSRSFSKWTPRISSQARNLNKWEDRQPIIDILGVHFAAHHGLSNLMTLLIGRGQSPNAQTTEGWTPLIYATRQAHASEIVDMLRCYNADPNIISNDNSTALEFAMRYGLENYLRLLLGDSRSVLHENVRSNMLRDMEGST